MLFFSGTFEHQDIVDLFQLGPAICNLGKNSGEVSKLGKSPHAEVKSEATSNAATKESSIHPKFSEETRKCIQSAVKESISHTALSKETSKSIQSAIKESINHTALGEETRKCIQLAAKQHISPTALSEETRKCIQSFEDEAASFGDEAQSLLDGHTAAISSILQGSKYFSNIEAPKITLGNLSQSTPPQGAFPPGTPLQCYPPLGTHPQDPPRCDETAAKKKKLHQCAACLKVEPKPKTYKRCQK